MRRVRWAMLRIKVYALQAQVKLKVISMILRGESVCYRASFVNAVSFSGDAPEMVECSFWEEGGGWRYTIDHYRSEWRYIE